MSFDISNYHIAPAPKCVFCGAETRWVKMNMPVCRTCLDNLNKGEVPMKVEETLPPPENIGKPQPSRWGEDTLAVTNTSEFALLRQYKDSMKVALTCYLIYRIAELTGLSEKDVLLIVRTELLDYPGKAI